MLCVVKVIDYCSTTELAVVVGLSFETELSSWFVEELFLVFLPDAKRRSWGKDCTNVPRYAQYNQAINNAGVIEGALMIN